MRVVFLSREFPPDTLWGGEAVACYEMARILASMRHQVHVICQAVDEEKDFVDENGIYVHRVGKKPKRYSVIARVDYSLHAIRKLHSLMRKYQIDIVEGFYGGSETFLYALLRSFKIYKAPLLLHAHGSIRHAILDTKSYRGAIGFLSIKLLLYLADFTARRSDIVIAISPVIWEELINESKVASDKIRLILTPRDTEKYSFVESDVRKRLGLNDKDKLVLTVGRLEMRKGIHILCQAIPLIRKEHPLTKFVFVGRDTPTGPKGSSYKEFLMTKFLREEDISIVRFIDYLSNSELVELYSAADVVVSPSLYEVSTSVPLEAMACGKPVVVTDTGTASLLCLDGTNGFIVPPGNSQRLGEAIVKTLALSQEERLVIAKKNREIVQKVFSYPQWIDKIRSLHEEITTQTFFRAQGI